MFSIFNFTNYSITDTTNKLVKAGAYKALLRTKINYLPIHYQDVFGNLGDLNIKIYTYSYQELIEDSNNTMDYFVGRCGDYGTIYYDVPDDYYTILYNSRLPEDQKNWVLLSLYACAELNLVPITGNINYSENMDEIVSEFVYHFAAPDLVLKEMGLYKAVDIAFFCCIPLKNALVKSRILKKKYSKNITVLSARLTYRFKIFIDIINNKKAIPGCNQE